MTVTVVNADVTTPSCSSGYYYINAGTTCIAISGAAVYSAGTTLIVGAAYVAGVTVDANNIVLTITCISGYVAMVNGAENALATATAGANSITGCLSCGGAAYKTCTVASNTATITAYTAANCVCSD